MPTMPMPRKFARPSEGKRAGKCAFALLLGLALSPPVARAQEDGDDPFQALPEEMRQRIEMELLKANGQLRVPIEQNAGARNRRIVINDPFGFDEEDEDDAMALEGAAVKTDSEMEDLLARAGEFAAGGRYDLAAQLWQEVVDRSGDIVFTKDEWIRTTLQHKYQRYRGITSEIEHTLAELPEAGREAYRLKADGEARALLRVAGEEGRETALGEVVRRYFLSSIGDDAAFELACLKLDRFEFLPAARLLSKVLREYPDPTVEKGALLIRLAAASGRIGDLAGAKELLKEAEDAGGFPAHTIALVREDIEAAASGVALASESGAGGTEWRMPGGTPSRDGTMAALPESYLAGALALGVEWNQNFELSLPEDWPREPNFDLDPYVLDEMAPTAGNVFGMANGLEEEPAKPEKVPTMEEKWRGGNWMPTGQMLLAGGRVYFKTHYQIVCADAATGTPNWLGFRNYFPMDRMSSVAGRYGGRMTDTGAPTSMEEIELFADHVHQGMCLAGEMLVTLEGQLTDFEEEKRPQARNINRFNRFGMGIDGRTNRARSNRLVAYHARSGKLRWSRYEGDGRFVDGDGITFAGTPVPYAGLLLAPVNIDGTLWLYAFALADGETLWASYLATEPAGSCSLFSPVTIAVEGGDAYVASGAGLVFSVDAVSGALNWATRYSRSSVEDPTDFRNRGFRQVMNMGRNLDGWEQDQVIPHGSALVFAGSDFDQLAAFDRRSGELLWESAREPFEGEAASTYVLGATGGNVYVAGPEVVRCYRIQGGRFLWETKVERSFAHGALTADAVYVPQAGSVVRLSLDEGAITGTYRVAPREVEPLGNLFSDGQRLLAFGLRRVYALTPSAEVAPAEAPAAPAPEPKIEAEPEAESEPEPDPETNKPS